jgi:hypothetical protein
MINKARVNTDNDISLYSHAIDLYLVRVRFVALMMTSKSGFCRSVIMSLL